MALLSRNGVSRGQLAAILTALTTAVKTTDKVIATDGIGVGNSAAAATPGTVTAKIEVFDENGDSLGFIAVYDAIT